MRDFDLGVIMGSQSDQIFEEMIELHRGAKYFYNNIQGFCTCGQRRCARLGMQSDLDGLFDGDQHQAGIFLDQLSTFDQQPTDIQIQAVLASLGIIVSTPEERRIVEDRLQEQMAAGGTVEEVIGQLFPGVEVIRLGLDDIDPNKKLH